MDTSIESPRRFVEATLSALKKTKCMAGSARGALDDPSTNAIFDSSLRMAAVTSRQFVHMTVSVTQGHRLHRCGFRTVPYAIAPDSIALRFQRRRIRLALGHDAQHQIPTRQLQPTQLKPHAAFRHRSWLLDREASSSPPFPVPAIELKVSTFQVSPTRGCQCLAQPARTGISSRWLFNPCSWAGSSNQRA